MVSLYVAPTPEEQAALEASQRLEQSKKIEAENPPAADGDENVLPPVLPLKKASSVTSD